MTTRAGSSSSVYVARARASASTASPHTATARGRPLSPGRPRRRPSSRRSGRDGRGRGVHRQAPRCPQAEHRKPSGHTGIWPICRPIPRPRRTGARQDHRTRDPRPDGGRSTAPPLTGLHPVLPAAPPYASSASPPARTSWPRATGRSTWVNASTGTSRQPKAARETACVGVTRPGTASPTARRRNPTRASAARARSVTKAEMAAITRSGPSARGVGRRSRTGSSRPE